MDRCHCTGAEAGECTEVCMFAGGFDDDDYDEADDYDFRG